MDQFIPGGPFLLNVWLGCSSVFQITFKTVSFFFFFFLSLAYFPLGKFEETISISFAKSPNLRAFMLKEGCPSAIKNCSGFFSKLIDSQVRNTLLLDIARFLSLEEEVDEPAEINGRVTAIAEGLYKALQTHFHGAKGIPHEARVLHYYKLNHLTFSTFTRHRATALCWFVAHHFLLSLPRLIAYFKCQWRKPISSFNFFWKQC